MIPLEKQVVSLELAKRLKELGVPQESYLYWMPDFATHYEYGLEGRSVAKSWRGVRVNPKREGEYLPADDFIFSAFTVAELGEMLPKEIRHKGKAWFLRLTVDLNAMNYHRCYGYESEEDLLDTAITDDTEADARAAMLVCLIEQGIVKCA